jgi:lysozyme family protein
MSNKFDTYINRVLGSEGNYSFNSKDPGGETKFGISKRSYPALDIKNLTREQAIEIYRRDFWQASRADVLPDALAFQSLDAAVNHGPSRAIKLLQASIGAVQDGAWGPASQRALDAQLAVQNEKSVLLLFMAARLEFWAATKDVQWDEFGRGWVNRGAADLRFAALDLA